MTESKLSQTARLLLTISLLDRRQNICYTEIIQGLRMGSICGGGGGGEILTISVFYNLQFFFFFFFLIT